MQHFPHSVPCWDVFEWQCPGPKEGNPFTEQHINALFSGPDGETRVQGFYDGDGVYRLRFMPGKPGAYSFTVEASFPLEKPSGRFDALPARENHHGPVRVRNTWDFAYEDGTPYLCLGTTCYAWAMQSDERIQQTQKALSESAFTKIRFCVFPKHYAYNLREPATYPYEGQLMDSRVLNEKNFTRYDAHAPGNQWDFTRFRPAHFRRLERCIRMLGEMGIQADLILFHPYDRWGFSCMPREADELYLRYVTARFSAYHNVWWSMANEYDLMTAKTPEDWERLAQLLCRCDPYRHLRSIHHCTHFYDFNRPWVTHCSIQRTHLYLSAELVSLWREQYLKPVVLDEMAYEGDLPYGWGNLTGEEMTRRFWEGALRGGHPGHGETLLHPDGVLWWSHGGTLRGESPRRIAFLRSILSRVPGGALQPNPAGGWDEVSACPAALGQEDQLYLYYYSFMRPAFRDYTVKGTYRVTVIDTWNMRLEDRGIAEGTFRVALPRRPYMAVLLEKQA